MNDLGPEARAILEAARGAETLSRTDRNRIKHAALLQVATLGAASTAAGGVVAMSAATKVTLIALTATVLGGGSLSLWAWKTRPTAPARTSRIGIAPPSRAAAPPATPVVFEEARPNPAPPETRRRHDGIRREARRPASGVAPVVGSGSTPNPAPVVVRAAAPTRTIQSLDPELAMLRQAQEDLRAGLPAQALRRLAEYDRRFVKGTLDEERQAIEAIATCQIHPGPAAQARADRFLRRAPESPLAERVRVACRKD
jgi:hypothetical protein